MTTRNRTNIVLTLALSVIAILPLSNRAHAAIVTLEASEDTYTQQNNSTTNYSTESTFSFGAAGGGLARSMLYRFDTSSLASIPAADIVSVTLQLTLASTTGTRTGFVGTLVDGNADWTVGGATWDTRNGTDTWVGAGGARTATDSELLEDSFLVNLSDAAGTVYSIPLSVSGTSYADFAELFAEWNDGTNNGMVTYNAGLIGASGVQTFHSSEATTAAFRPQLIVEHNFVAVPEPSTFILATLGLLSIGVTRRRRRR